MITLLKINTKSVLVATYFIGCASVYAACVNYNGSSCNTYHQERNSSGMMYIVPNQPTMVTPASSDSSISISVGSYSSQSSGIDSRLPSFNSSEFGHSYRIWQTSTQSLPASFNRPVTPAISSWSINIVPL